MTRSKTSTARPGLRARLTCTAAVSALPLVVAGLGLAGCSQFSPQTTQLQYAASDGINHHVGDVGVRNLLLVSEEDGGSANVVGTFVNDGDTPVTFTVDGADGEPVEVPAGGRVATGEDPVIHLDVDATAGMTVPVTITGGEQEMKLTVPLLDGTLPEYQTLVPTERPSATATASPSVAASSSAPPSATTTP